MDGHPFSAGPEEVADQLLAAGGDSEAPDTYFQVWQHSPEFWLQRKLMRRPSPGNFPCPGGLRIQKHSVLRISTEGFERVRQSELTTKFPATRGRYKDIIMRCVALWGKVCLP
jgi:hypothetical protein